MAHVQPVYCYVDESGQDVASDNFFVVAVVSVGEQHSLRDRLVDIERLSRTGARKWHKSRQGRRMSYLDAVLERNLPVNGVFVGRFVKPIPYFFPVLETIERALNTVTMNGRRAIVTVDGIDRKKAAELTSALRIRGLRLEFVRSARDESEPIIRLADMWSGCVRAAFLGDGEAKLRYIRAVECGYLNDITK